VLLGAWFLALQGHRASIVPEHEATAFVLNVRNHLPSDTVSHLRRLGCGKLVILNVQFSQKLKFRLLSKVQNISSCSPKFGTLFVLSVS
jgi:hypothetical protein